MREEEGQGLPVGIQTTYRPIPSSTKVLEEIILGSQSPRHLAVSDVSGETASTLPVP